MQCGALIIRLKAYWLKLCVKYQAVKDVENSKIRKSVLLLKSDSQKIKSPKQAIRWNSMTQVIVTFGQGYKSYNHLHPLKKKKLVMVTLTG